MKHPDKVVIAILDAGVFDWWNKEDTPLARAYQSYYNAFEMEFIDYADTNPSFKDKPEGDHGFWVLDRTLQVCGNPNKIKIINGKIFSAEDGNSASLTDAIADQMDRTDIINLSLGSARSVPYSFVSLFLSIFNSLLNEFVANGGYTIISAGNEGEVLSNGSVVENGNWLADDPNNNLSVASHNAQGEWDVYSSAGGTVDVSAIGSDLRLLGQRKISTVSGTSFSAPSFTGLCGNYLLNQFSQLRDGSKTAKEIIDSHLTDAIPPVTRKLMNGFRKAPEHSPWYGHGSYESYIKWMINHYGRGSVQLETFYRYIESEIEKEKNEDHSSFLQVM